MLFLDGYVSNQLLGISTKLCRTEYLESKSTA